MSSNIFDQDPLSQQSFTPEPPPRQKSGLVSFLAGTATLAFLAAVAPIYIHILVKIAIWSWNLI